VRFGQAFSVDCVVMLCDACDQDWDENDLSSKTIAVFLTPASETSQIRGGVPTAQDPWLKYFFSFSTEVILNNEVKLTQTGSKQCERRSLRNWSWINIFLIFSFNAKKFQKWNRQNLRVWIGNFIYHFSVEWFHWFWRVVDVTYLH